MKTVLRILIVCLVLVLVILVGGYVALMNPGVQKRLVEGRLPEGSSIESIHVTMGQVSVLGLVWVFADGTRVRLGAVDAAFEPLAAVFKQTIKTGLIQVKDLRIERPAVTVTPVSIVRSSAVPPPHAGPASESPAAPQVAINRIEDLYALGNFKWLFDVEGIALEALIDDGNGGQYRVQVDAPPIRPGQLVNIHASLHPSAATSLPPGLTSFDSSATLQFKQTISGGVESLRLESNTSGEDAEGNRVFAIRQHLDWAFDTVAAVVTASLALVVDVPQPQVLAPQLATLGALNLTGQVQVSTDGQTLTVNSGGFKASVAGVERVVLDLKRNMTLGGEPAPSDDLLDVTLTALPLEWLNPWLADQWCIDSQVPVSCALSVAAAPSGALIATVAEPIQLGPLTLTGTEGPLLQHIIVRVSPELQLNPDQSLRYALNSLSVADPSGVLIQGSSSGLIQLAAARDAAHPFAGIQAQSTFQIGLQEVLQLPLLADRASIVSGQLGLDLTIDASADSLLRLDAEINGLRARGMPAVSQDFAVALRLQPTSNSGEWQIAGESFAGTVSRPSTSLQGNAVLNARALPLTFSADLYSPLVRQHDVSILIDALTPRAHEAAPARLRDPAEVPVRDIAESAVAVPNPPLWAMLEGRVSLRIDKFRLQAGQMIESIALQALVSEPKLIVNPLTATIGAGELNGSGAVWYSASQLKPYSLSANIRCADVNPAWFFGKHQKSPPIQGQFNGLFELSGAGETLDAALEDSTATLEITGEQGVLTAFELDERTQRGLGLAGLLGQHLDRPGITALTHTIPYFKNIPFSHFVFELTRGANNDKRILIPQLRLTGESLLLDASGLVEASKLSEVMDQPLDLQLILGAKGPLTDHLKMLELLQPAAAEDGFTRWNEELEIAGTLADPDTSALMDLLNDAAKRALSKSNRREETPTTEAIHQSSTPFVPESDGAIESSTRSEALQEPNQRSKQERRRDDIEMGLELLNSWLGD